MQTRTALFKLNSFSLILSNHLLFIKVQLVCVGGGGSIYAIFTAVYHIHNT